MPNYVKNKIVMDGIKELNIFTVQDDGNLHIDFSKIISMPKELEVVSGSIEKISVEAAFRKCKGIVIGLKFMNDEEYKNCVKNTGKTEDELAEIGLIYITNSVKYGFTDWYGWRIKNWGTKWNALKTEIISDDEITFETAWSALTPILKMLAKMNPDKVVEHWWADEDIGYNTGYKKYQGENELESYYPDLCSSDAFEFYVECWNDTDNLEKDEDGFWHFCNPEEGEV